MKILLINKYDFGGGAAIASKRLLSTLRKFDIDANLLVHVKKSSDENIFSVVGSKVSLLYERFLFYFEKVVFILFEKNSSFRFLFSTSFLGINIANNELVRSADILHIHWTNHSFLSTKGLRKLFELNKPVVITMHDMWYFTGGCHNASECTKFRHECGSCPMLKTNNKRDLSFLHLNNISILYSAYSPVFIGCSNWITKEAKNSKALIGKEVISIPNPIDVDLFRPRPNSEVKRRFGIGDDAKVILFSSAKVSNERKGFSYFKSLVEIGINKGLLNDVTLLIVGEDNHDTHDTFLLPTVYTGFLSSPEDIADCYNAADLYLTPSLEDNLPNTLVESMSCGTPCVGFNVGGIPEIIDHKKNGYVAEYKNVDDLLEGVCWVLNNRSENMKQSARDKVLNTYSEEVVIDKFISLYRRLLSTT